MVITDRMLSRQEHGKTRGDENVLRQAFLCVEIFRIFTSIPFILNVGAISFLCVAAS